MSSERQSFTRINTLELKALIVKRIGHQRAGTYFDQLTRLFSSKITKSEFDKFCIKIIGRENIPLHNRLIKAIAKNACLAKVAPPKGIQRKESNLNVKTPRNSLQSIYGDAFPLSPRKGRSPVDRNRKFSDRPSPLGPLGKPQSLLSGETTPRAQEQQSATELLSLGSRPPVEVASVEDGEEVEQESGSLGVQSRSPVTCPFGVSMNLGGARKTLVNLPIGGGHLRETCLNTGLLPDTRLLRSRLERKLESEGISVSVDCVNLLNSALDVYLKRLIEPCIGLASSRRRSDHLRKVNGMFVPGSSVFLPGSSVVSMLDFHAAMELNPQILGEGWPTILEKISMGVYEGS